MRLRILYFLLVVFSLNAFNSEAQNQRKQALTLVKYKENVKAPLNAAETKMLQEVFSNRLNEYVLNNPQRLKDFKHLLRNRIEIRSMPELVGNNDKYQTLSQVGLMNSYNENLKLDTTYNPSTFNPLKYNLKFFGKGGAIYRIDNTNYFIIIKSQHE